MRITAPIPSYALAVLLVSTVVPFGGCGSESAGPVPIEESRVRELPAKPAEPNVSGMERFGFERRAGAPEGPAAPMPQPASPATGPGDAPASEAPMADAPDLQWDAPAGWVEASAGPMRVVSFQAAPRTECYVSALPGDGGGLAGNLNRWRRQMGAEPLTADALNALPAVELLGEPVPLLNVAGTFTSMQGASSPEYRMLGAVRLLPGRAVFVKMVGPDTEVAAQREAFVAFCESLRFGDGA